MDTNKIILIVPCFNEESRLNIKAFENFFKSDRSVQFLFVNDGSSDSTLNVLNELSKNNSDKVKVLNLEKNVGKAEAVRMGVQSILHENNSFDYIGFWDADLATPLSEVPRFFDLAASKQFYAITGCRILRLGGNIVRKWYRHYLGRVFATFASISLNLPFYDTQCGSKVFRIDIAEKVFNEKFLSNWLFDIEIFFRIKKEFLELPLYNWEDIHGSKLKLVDFIKAPLELLKINLHYR
jgi:dolichyl-phosphate beta-glucosyltransferase